MIIGMVSVDNFEDVIGGYVWVSLFCIVGGLFYIVFKFISWVKKILIWLGEVYLFYSLGVLAIVGFSVVVFVFINEIVYFSIFYGFIGGNYVWVSLVGVYVILGFLVLLGYLWYVNWVCVVKCGVFYGIFFNYIVLRV